MSTIWEYRTIRQQAIPGQPLAVNESLLAHLGFEGWELVSIVPIQAKTHGTGGKLLLEGSVTITTCDLVFKRQKQYSSTSQPTNF